MLAPKARWSIGHADEELVRIFVQELQIDPLVARILVLRDIRTVPAAKQFLNGSADDYHDPFGLDGMREAVERIRKALDNGEFIRIYGDYDADGVSSTSLMAHLLDGLGAKFDTYIPHRIREGYGLNRGAVTLAKEQGVQLLITVDTGISAAEEIAYCRELGLDVIVTDHHEPPERLPEALAVINPKKPGCPYPYKYLAGVGVAFKLAHALLGRFPDELLEFAALGTVADLMPLTGENRLIVKHGLERMQDSAYAGFRALIAVSGIERKEVTAGHIGFSLAPKINASGRLEAADIAVKLLTTRNLQEAEQIAAELDMLNKERQQIVEDMVSEAFVMAEAQREKGMDKVIVVAAEGWNVGVVGIVASKIVERYYRPTLVLSIDPATGKAKGSARSIAGFDLYQALTACKELFDHYGGHQAAAGMTLKRSHLDELTHRLNEIAASLLTEQDYIPLIKADSQCHLADVPIACIEQLELLAPFGMGNPSPRFLFSGASLSDIRTMGKEKQHLKLGISQAKDEVACTVEAVAFGKGHIAGLITPSASIDVVGELSINEWNGVRKPQIVLQDIRIEHKQVFDWRGAGQLRTRLNGLSGALAGSPYQITPGLVLFQTSDEALYRAPGAYLGEEVPYWVLEDDQTLRPGNPLAESLRFDEAQDVVFYTMPGSIADLTNVIQQAAGMLRCYAVFAELGGGSGSTMPSREMFKMLYAFLQREASLQVEDTRVMTSLSKRSGMSPEMIHFILSVFEELSFVQKKDKIVTINPAPAKKDLASSRLYQQRAGRQEVESIVMYSSAKELEQWMARYMN
ncbi:single-stranded-DNA-specific exonuclease RecJ [Paenibacillus whitsoniae]|uniref:Single-stranded-DNA-specific exonuclease RecJ n=1 Tax=Paenibacillus whitsoniae TaxID=2496558 RepID=A0A430JB61_9BACL|nr:single-stranded-DNA-specific exonuclease RecJ [Paenibacillus whitsoniae]RTE08270.1 single-stranded-DNA-specific exonuclease RecJ [Paenibacillus whitsoniae]